MTDEAKQTLVARVAPIADKYVGRFISKRFLAWVIATVAMWTGHLPPEEWRWITTVYLGQQGVQEAVAIFKNGGKRA